METVDRKYKNGNFISSLRYHTVEEWKNYRDIPDWKRETLVTCAPYTATHQEAMLQLIANVEHVVKCDIPGDFVETGVFMGGSCMIITEVLKHFGVNDRAIWMYDTYEGVPQPNEIETDPEGKLLNTWWKENAQIEGQSSSWCNASLTTVKEHMKKVNYSGDVHFVKGMVEDTIPHQGPDTIALLRIDVDLEYPTRHVLDHFYPRLSVGGHVIFDDYGMFPSVQHTVDHYFYHNKSKIYLDRVDSTVVHGIKV
tara:strand:- start:5660 stop:6418 length:759 start_codon:yes stop_codon:yes gene_type:complete